MNIGTRYKVAFMSGSYLAKVSHVYIYHKVSLMSVYNIAKVRLLYIYIYIQAKVRSDKSETVGHLPVAHLQGIHIDR